MQYGDMTAIHPKGIPLIKKILFEFKRGYPGKNPYDMIDRRSSGAVTKIEKWIAKNNSDSVKAGCFSWMMVMKKNNKKGMICIPLEFKHKLMVPLRWITNSATINHDLLGSYFFCGLDDFFQCVQPKHIKRIKHDQ